MSITVRKAGKKDIQAIIALLHQVDMVHHVIRPDLFKPNTTKYNEQELEALLDDESKPMRANPSSFSMTDKCWDMLSVWLQKLRMTSYSRTSRHCILMTSVLTKRPVAGTSEQHYTSSSVTMQSLKAVIILP